LQNKDAFAWFQPFLDAREAALHTAGSLRQGSRIWVLAKLNRDPLVIAEGDEVEKFLLLSHGHDGSLAVRCGFTPVRVVCANTCPRCGNTLVIRDGVQGGGAEQLGLELRQRGRAVEQVGRADPAVQHERRSRAAFRHRQPPQQLPGEQDVTDGREPTPDACMP
jgi:hypothetical protein